MRALHPDEPDVVKCKRQWTEKAPSGWFRSAEVQKFSGCYVKGMLQPTKSFGDFYLKEESLGFDFDRQRTFVNPAHKKSFPYITAEPDITVFSRSTNDQLIVLGSDGLWDELNEQQVATTAIEAFNRGATPEEISHKLIEVALAQAAESAKLRVDDLKRLPQGRDRRSLHDDISVVVLVLN
jgi:pyruvate dehydrogenase phosphatase